MGFILIIIIFGVLQGLTEFLPVSSSGHLSLFQYFSKDINENLSLNVAVHIGTLLTVLIFYRSDLKDIFKGLRNKDRESISMCMAVIVASIPTAIIGLLMKKNAGWILTNPVVAAGCLLITGLILFVSDRIQVKQNFQSGFGVSYMGALLIGFVQGFAVLPGISRSGSTIVAGLFLGMNPKNAARFSFLISVPAIAGAGLLEFLGMEANVELTPFLLGGVISFLTGLAAISWMVRLTMKGHLKFFSYYVFALSILFFISYGLGIGEGIL